MTETVAAVFGGLYFLVGVIGLLLTPGGGAILGIFPANLFHHLFHLVVGGLGPVCAWRRWGRRYCQVTGVVFLVLAVLGFVAPRLAALILAQPDADMLTDNLLHLMTGIGLSYFGFVPQGSPVYSPADRKP
jgi:uncharacterized protein DUF4383